MDIQKSSILILGEKGQLATSFSKLGFRNFAFAGSKIVNLKVPSSVFRQLEQCYQYRPFQILINTAAYTAVDRAESEIETANAINGYSVGEIAKWCKNKNIFFVHYSTDYVFSGEGMHTWRESDVPSPCNAYGKSKLLGEQKMLEVASAGLILRTSWVHSPDGLNLVNKMLSLVERSELQIVNDQVGSPTYAPHLARASMQILQCVFNKYKSQDLISSPTEIFHVTNQGFTSWYDFAFAIFHRAREMQIIEKIPTPAPTTTAKFRTPAKRPMNSRLSCEKLKEHLGIQLPAWQVGLDEGLREIKKLKGY